MDIAIAGGKIFQVAANIPANNAKKVIDVTAAVVEIQIDLAPGISPDITIDALYAFTDCEVSISPNACVITKDRPQFSLHLQNAANTEKTYRAKRFGRGRRHQPHRSECDPRYF